MPMPSTSQKPNGVFVLSFSGIDGAGKSTQIERLHSRLADLRVIQFRFWEDVATFRRLREFASHVLLQGEQGVGAPGRPVNRKDKNVQSRYLTLIRLVFCLLDTLSLRWCLTKASGRKRDVILFDRYIYDELANLPLENAAIRFYARFLVRLAPQPEISYFLDADPEIARLRKPEYPLEFLCQNRARYWMLAGLVRGLTIIQPRSPFATEALITRTLEHLLPPFVNVHSAGRRISAGSPDRPQAEADRKSAMAHPNQHRDMNSHPIDSLQ